MNKVAQDNFLFCATASALLCFSICDENLEADFHLFVNGKEKSYFSRGFDDEGRIRLKSLAFLHLE